MLIKVNDISFVPSNVIGHCANNSRLIGAIDEDGYFQNIRLKSKIRALIETTEIKIKVLKKLEGKKN